MMQEGAFIFFTSPVIIIRFFSGQVSILSGRLRFQVYNWSNAWPSSARDAQIQNFIGMTCELIELLHFGAVVCVCAGLKQTVSFP